MENKGRSLLPSRSWRLFWRALWTNPHPTSQTAPRGRSFGVTASRWLPEPFADSYFCHTVELWNWLPVSVFAPSHDVQRLLKKNCSTFFVNPIWNNTSMCAPFTSFDDYILFSPTELLLQIVTCSANTADAAL